jgi:hypothetical protein
MATAAPSVPSAPAAPVAADAGTPDTTQPQSTPATPVESASSEPTPEKRSIRPIPPKRPSLPGVDDVGPHDSLPPLPQRDATGRFAKPGEKPADPASPSSESDAPAEPPPPQKVKFAGGEFDTMEHAEQSFRTLRGMHKSVLAKEGEARTRAWELHEHLNRAQARVAELEGQLRGGKAGATQTQPAAQPGAPGAEAEGIDWELFASIQSEAQKAGKPEVAIRWLTQQQEALYQKKLEALTKQLREPQERQEATENVQRQAYTLADILAARVNTDGAPLYPELRDAQLAEGVGRAWIAAGLPPEAALTESGLVAAIGLYRMQNPSGQPATPTVPPATTPVAPAAPANPGPDPATLADAGIDGSGAPFDRPPLEESGLPPEIASIRQAFRHNPRQLTSLGFDR